MSKYNAGSLNFIFKLRTVNQDCDKKDVLDILLALSPEAQQLFLTLKYYLNTNTSYIRTNYSAQEVDDILALDSYKELYAEQILCWVKQGVFTLNPNLIVPYAGNYENAFNRYVIAHRTDEEVEAQRIKEAEMLRQELIWKGVGLYKDKLKKEELMARHVDKIKAIKAAIPQAKHRSDLLAKAANATGYTAGVISNVLDRLENYLWKSYKKNGLKLYSITDTSPFKEFLEETEITEQEVVVSLVFF